MKGLKYQMKSVLRDKFCLMTFLLPILVAVALHFMGSIDMSSLGELHFGVLENDLSPQTVTWLERYGPVTAYGTQEELTAAINEPSTNVIGVRADCDSLKTAISGDELDIFRQAAATLPTLYERREAAGQAEIQTLERPDIMESLQGIFIPAVLIVAMFMGCTNKRPRSKLRGIERGRPTTYNRICYTALPPVLFYIVSYTHFLFLDFLHSFLLFLHFHTLPPSLHNIHPSKILLPIISFLPGDIFLILRVLLYSL